MDGSEDQVLLVTTPVPQQNVATSTGLGKQALGAEELQGPGWGERPASISLVNGGSPLQRHPQALPAPEGPGDARQTRSPALHGARRGFANPRLTSARPCRALLLLQRAGGFVRPRLRQPPPSACPHLAVYIECAAVLIRGSLGPESSLEGERERGSGRAPRGCGCREREKESRQRRRRQRWGKADSAPDHTEGSSWSRLAALSTLPSPARSARTSVF
ncbi:uncharacterized protein LOC116272094 [Papio anubis]|uniref:uncharacterized protein LOC116272094 n=1 Tax=Papio anubis TaxID=9555 RepID=UPI0012AD93D9|nr:uncharacterized protein LOC116272094 [Papio anubis]